MQNPIIKTCTLNNILTHFTDWNRKENESSSFGVEVTERVKSEVGIVKYYYRRQILKPSGKGNTK
jgi:hypothetical protein